MTSDKAVPFQCEEAMRGHRLDGAAAACFAAGKASVRY